MELMEAIRLLTEPEIIFDLLVCLKNFKGKKTLLSIVKC
jgi:hypothetical protein